MAITNYGSLKAKISRLLFHQRFLPDYDDATTQFENAVNRRLRVRQMEGLNIFQTGTGWMSLPADYLVWRTVLWIRGGVPLVPPPDAPYPNVTELDYVHPAYLRELRVDRGNPKVFTIEGDRFYSRVPTTGVDAYEFHYYQKIPTLVGSDGNVNWLLSAYPDVYVAGLMTELMVMGRNTEMAQLEKARRDELLQEIIQLSALTTGATSPKVRVAEYY